MVFSKCEMERIKKNMNNMIWIACFQNPEISYPFHSTMLFSRGPHFIVWFCARFCFNFVFVFLKFYRYAGLVLQPVEKKESTFSWISLILFVGWCSLFFIRFAWIYMLIVCFSVFFLLLFLLRTLRCYCFWSRWYCESFDMKWLVFTVTIGCFVHSETRRYLLQIALCS